MTKRIKLRYPIKDYLFILSLIIIPLIQFLVFWLYVNLDSILMAFKGLDDDGNEYWTLNNFVMLFHDFSLPDSIIIEATVNTLLIFLSGVFVATPICLIAAFFMLKRMPLGNFYKILFFLPSMISMVAFVYVFTYFIGVDGPLMQIWVDMGLSLEDFPVFLGQGWAMPTILIYNIWSGLGFTTIVTSSNMNRIPLELFESAKIDGGGFIREFFNIALPLIWPSIASMAVFNMAGMFSYLGPIMLMTEGSYNTSTIGYYIFQNVTSGDPKQMYYPAAIGMFFTIVAAPLILLVRKGLNSFWQDVTF